MSDKVIPDIIYKQRINNALATSDCPKISGRTFGEVYYKGTLIDTHYHIPHLQEYSPPWEEDGSGENNQPLLGKSVKISEIVCTMEQEGTSKVFAFFPVFPHLDWQSLEVVKRTMGLYPSKFVPFIMTPDNDNDPNGFPTVKAELLEEFLRQYPSLFKGYGEIGLYARKGGAPELPPDSQRLIDIYPVIRDHNLLVYFHLGEGHKDNFERILEQNPDINFIWHGDQLIKYEEEGRQNLKDVEDILSKHSNAYYGIDELYGDVWLLRPEVSKEEFLKHFNDYEKLLEKDLTTWKGFIERHPDQVLWGTDRGWSAPWSVDADVGLILANYSRAFIAKLDTNVQEKFAWKNAQKLMEQVGAVEEKPASVGYIGCSNTRQIMDGYRMVGGSEIWKPDVQNPRDYDGGAVKDWVEGTKEENKFWKTFDKYLSQNPNTNSVWWHLCVRKEDNTTYGDTVLVLDAVRKRISNVKVYVSSLAEYTENVCEITGVEGIEKGRILAQELADKNEDVLVGPKFGPLPQEELLSDGCHLNNVGVRKSGKQVQQFFSER